MPTTDHQFGASNIYRLNLLFLQLKDKREVGESWCRSGLVVEGGKAGLRVGPGGDADCPVWAQEQGSERPAGRAGALGPPSAPLPGEASTQLHLPPGPPLPSLQREGRPPWAVSRSEYTHGRTWDPGAVCDTEKGPKMCGVISSLWKSGFPWLLDRGDTVPALARSGCRVKIKTPCLHRESCLCSPG